MSSTSAPTPFDPPDIPAPALALVLGSRTSLRLVWEGQPPIYTTQLVTLGLCEQMTTGWQMTIRGYQVAAWLLARGLL